MQYLTALSLCSFAFAVPYGPGTRGHPVLPQPYPQLKGHKAIEGFPNTPDPKNAYIDRWRPYLKVTHGCTAYPAVDKEGFISGGLEYGGAEDGECEPGSSPGQSYGRTKHFTSAKGSKRFAVMFSWYFPKEQYLLNGFKYSWQSFVMWFKYQDNNPNGRIAYYPYIISFTEGYEWFSDVDYNVYRTDKVDTEVPLAAKIFDGLNFKTQFGVFESYPPPGTIQPPAISWEGMTPQARYALNTFVFGKDTYDQQCHFNDKNFQSSLQAAWLSTKEPDDRD